MKIIVTGAAGFIGSHTVDRLLAEGHQVVGIDNLRTGSLANISNAQSQSDFIFHRSDVSDHELFNGIVAEVSADAIIHLVALVSVQESITDPDLNFELNVCTTHGVAEAARKNKVPRLVFASSAAVYGNPAELPLREESPKVPLSPYGAAKLASEALLLGYAASFGVTTVCLRYFNAYGPRQSGDSPYSGVISSFARRLSAGLPPRIYGDGSQTRDFIHVHDIARANLRAATAPEIISGPFNICTGIPLSLRDLADRMIEAFRNHCNVEFHPSRPADIERSFGSCESARKVLEFSPVVDFDVGLQTLVSSQTAIQIV